MTSARRRRRRRRRPRPLVLSIPRSGSRWLREELGAQRIYHLGLKLPPTLEVAALRPGAPFVSPWRDPALTYISARASGNRYTAEHFRWLLRYALSGGTYLVRVDAEEWERPVVEVRLGRYLGTDGPVELDWRANPAHRTEAGREERLRYIRDVRLSTEAQKDLYPLAPDLLGVGLWYPWMEEALA